MSEPITWALYLLGFAAVLSSGFVEEKRDAWLLTVVALCWPLGALFLIGRRLWEVGRG